MHRQQQLIGIDPQGEGHHLRVASVSTQVTASRLLDAPLSLTFAFVRIDFVMKPQQRRQQQRVAEWQDGSNVLLQYAGGGWAEGSRERE